MSKMNPEIKAKWLEALRSGKYTQGHNQLRELGTYDGEVRHCCLGVLCELAADEGVVERGTSEAWTYRSVGATHGIWAYPDQTVYNWAGIARQLNDDDEPVEHIEVAQMNDNGRSFEEIATWIEVNW